MQNLKDQEYSIKDLILTDKQKNEQEKVNKEINGVFYTKQWSLINYSLKILMPTLDIPKKRPTQKILHAKKKELQNTSKDIQKQIKIIGHLLGSSQKQIENELEEETFYVDQIDQNCIIAELAGINTETEITKSEAGKALFKKH